MNKFISRILIVINLMVFSPFLIFLIISRFFIKIKIVEIETRAIGHYAAPMEIFLCEINNKVHGENNIYIAFKNKSVANNFLYNKIKKNFIVFPRIILEPIFKFFNFDIIYRLFGKKFISEYRHWHKNYTFNKPFQNVDIYDVLPKTLPTIIFDKNETELGHLKLKEINLNVENEYVCFHFRTPHHHYRKKIINKFTYQNRDVRNLNYFKTVDYLSEKNIKSVLIGENIKENKKNKNMIYYNNSHIRNDFLDIFLLSKCKYLIGSSSGMTLAPIIFRKKIMYIDVPHIHSLYEKDSIYNPFMLIKKFISLKTGKYLHYSEVFEKKLSEIDNIKDLNSLGYDIEDNSEEEIFYSCRELEMSFENKQDEYFDEKKDQLFNNILNRFNMPNLKKSKISSYFLFKNINLIC